MDWTDADQRQLDQLEAQAKELEAQAQGDPAADAHVAAVSKPARPEEAAYSGFSPVRLILGVGRDVIEGALQTSESLGDYAESKVPLPIVRFGSNASNGYVDIVTGDQAKKFAASTNQLPHLGNLKGSETASQWEQIPRAIGSFLIPYAGWARKFSVAKAGIGVAERIARGAAAGAATDFVNMPPDTNNMATVLKDTFGLDNPTLDWLAYNPEDNALEQRLKAAATNLPVGVAADGLFELGAKAIRAYGVIKGEAEEARGIVEAMEHDYGVKTVKQPKAAAEADAEAGMAQAAPVPSEEPFSNAIHVALNEAKPQTWEDISSFLERMVDDPNLKEEELAQLGKIVQGDPENALARMGIDPAKLDYHAFENPEGITNLQKSLINIYEKVGKRLGRTTETVSEAEIHTAARSMATEAEVLKTLFGATKNLPEILMGARLFVGSHAHKLLADATAALDALRSGEGAGTQEWQQFLQTFHRHALYLGTVRGAGSEIGRALRSLRMIARTDPKAAEALAADVTAKVGAGVKADPGASADELLEGVKAISEDSEKIMLLSKLLEKGDDIGQLAQFVRGQAGSTLKRLDGMSRETVGSLFSAATAAYNIKSGLSMLSFRGLGRWMAAAARLPLALAGGEQARAFRVAAMDAWAYMDGALGAIGEAYRNTMNVIEKEAASELYINADNLGLKKLAKKAALWNAAKGKELEGKNFTRVDIDASPRRFALNPSDRRALEEIADSENLPTLVGRALKWYVRAGGAALNATGTAFRAGTILLINAPDELIGTIAARAGAQSYAVRDAAARAAELGIEGPALTKYLRARVASLTSDITGWADRGLEEGQREAAKVAGEHERREILFQDGLELKSSRAMAKAHREVLGATLFVPFMHTPLRILERTLIDYTPLGLAKSRMRDAILRGTPQQREQALSQLGLGIFAMMMGYHMARDRDIVGTDGGFTSSARMNRESYSMRIGADVYEFLRDDPLGTLLGMGADVHAGTMAYDPDDPEAENKVKAMFESGVWAIAMNTLSKTWLESIKNLTDLAGSLSEGQFSKGLDNYLRLTFARRLVPAAGIQKAFEMAFDPYERQATSFQEEMLKNSIGAYKLPTKRNWLGESEEKNLGERFIGLTWKPENRDPVIRELDRLSFDTRLPERDIKGVKLNATQYSRLLQLRGEEVQGDYGTLKETVEKLINHPQWKSMTDPAKVEQLRMAADGFTEKAKNALLQEDPELAAAVIRKANYDDQRKKGKTQDELRQQNEDLGRALGLIK